jgi:hypothetical protein
MDSNVVGIWMNRFRSALRMHTYHELWIRFLVGLDIWVNEHLPFQIWWDFFRWLFWRAWKCYLYICRQVSNLHTWVNVHLWDFNAIYMSTGLYAQVKIWWIFTNWFFGELENAIYVSKGLYSSPHHPYRSSVTLGLGLQRVHQTRTDTMSRYINK